MLTADCALTFIKFRDDDIFNVQFIHADSYGNDINDRINGTDFMKMNFVYRLIMSLRLSFCNNLKDF